MKRSLLLLMPLIITGCATQRDKQLWSIGVVVYGFYLLGLLLTFLVPALHQSQLFRRMINVAKVPAVVLAKALIVAGLIIMIGGVVIQSHGLTYHLIPLVGCVVFVLGQCLRMWAISIGKSTERQTVYAKAIAISVGCILGLTYIINGADMLKF